MNQIKHYWKVWLRSNHLQKKKGTYVAQVLTVSITKRNEDVARQIVSKGSELRYETILSVLNQGEQVVREFLQNGYRVNTENCRYIPRVSGAWESKSTPFNSEVHRITLDIIPATKMKEALAEVAADVISLENEGAWISHVTDISTGSTDDTVTSGESIMIEGDRIKILPEADSETGVFFTDEAGNEVKVERRLTLNMPKKLLLRIPELPGGAYTLRLVTRFSNGTVLLKEPRTIEYRQPLRVV